MRVYHFLSAEHALDDITHRHIKISQIDNLNDPFELWCSAQHDAQLRRVLRVWKRDMALQYGMICFCKGWRNPVLWSHYADKHRGICLGFEIADGMIAPVKYVSKRISLDLPGTDGDMKELLYTKYRDWRYEQEWRAWSRLEERDPTGHYFYNFDEKVQLCEVVAGPLCTAPKAVVEAAIAGYKGIGVIQARLAYTTFQIVPDKRGFWGLA